MNTDSPNTGAKIQYDLVYSPRQLGKIIYMLSQLAMKYSWNMNITNSVRRALNYGLKHKYGIVYWCHLDPVKKRIMFSPQNSNKNSYIGACSSPSILTLCAELYIVNGCNSDELVKYESDIDRELVPELSVHNNFVSSSYISQIHRQTLLNLLDSKDDKVDLLNKIDPSIEYLYVTSDTETILNFLKFNTRIKRKTTEGVLAKKAYIEELLGCNFEEFCKLVPNEIFNNDALLKDHIPGSYFSNRIAIGGHIFEWEAFKQHTDMDIKLFQSMLKKVNHSIYMSRNSNALFQFNNGMWSYYIYTKPPEIEERKNIINKALAYNVKIINMQQDRVQIKSYNILKEELTIKIEENEKFN
jgi:hypothetical protein